MDIRNITNVYIAKNCTRTAGTDTYLTPGVDGIDGKTVTGVQVNAPLLDDDITPATTYFGPGELLVTSGANVALTTTTALKTVEGIKIHSRSLNGENKFSSTMIKGSDITDYTLSPYRKAEELVNVISGIDASLVDYTYLVKITKRPWNKPEINNGLYTKTASFHTALAGNTAAEIAQGLVDSINTLFKNDGNIPIRATVGGVGGVDVIITAKPMDWSLGKVNYQKLRFVVSGLNFDSTITENETGDLTHNAVTYLQATSGQGTYEQVAEMEYFALLSEGVNQDLVSPSYARTIVLNSAISTETYDMLTINWMYTGGALQISHKMQGSIVIALAVTDNATSQVGVALKGIVATLDKYIATEHGIGIVEIGNLT